MKHSVRSKTNMTEQVLTQLEFFEKNLERKKEYLAYNKKYFTLLPGFRWTIIRQMRGIDKAKLDIKNHKLYISILEEKDKIFQIL